MQLNNAVINIMTSPARIDRVRHVTALVNQLNPLAVRYRDTLYMHDGPYPWTVCRVEHNPATFDIEESYICTNGERTRRIYDYELHDIRHMHYRDGRRVHAMTFADLY